MEYTIIDALCQSCQGFTLPEAEARYIRLPEESELLDRVTGALGREDVDELELLMDETAALHERQGFLNGFRMAMGLMAEVLA